MNKKDDLDDISLPIIEIEIDKPREKPSIPDKGDVPELTPAQKRDWQKWLKNYGFLKFIILMMAALYVSSVFLAIFAPDADLAMQEPFFEVLKIILFAASGYVFAKGKE